jgi:hypothetical protein
MASKRAKSNRGRFMGKRRAKLVTLDGHIEITPIGDPKHDKDEAWRLLELVDDFQTFKKTA